MLMGSATFSALLFADDLNEWCKDINNLEKIIKIMEHEFSRFGLYVSFKKTSTQEWAARGKPEFSDRNSMFTIAGNEIENVTSSKVLGQMLNSENEKGYVENRVAKSNGQYHRYKEVLSDWNVCRFTRVKFLEAYVRSTLLYGVCAEVPSESHIDALKTFWYTCLRKMSPGGFTRRTNENDEFMFNFKYTRNDLDNYFSTPPIGQFIHVSFLKYVAHVVRRDASHPTKQILFIQPDKKYAKSAVWRKVEFLLKPLCRDDIVKKMNDRAVFSELLEDLYPYLTRRPSESTWLTD